MTSLDYAWAVAVEQFCAHPTPRGARHLRRITTEYRNQ
jgi:hypothetical protein